jgi:hypothetical protein
MCLRIHLMLFSYFCKSIFNEGQMLLVHHLYHWWIKSSDLTWNWFTIGLSPLNFPDYYFPSCLITETFININFTTSCRSTLIHSKTAFNLVRRTYLKLPWKPLICIDGSTVYELDDEFNVRNKSSLF